MNSKFKCPDPEGELRFTPGFLTGGSRILAAPGMRSREEGLTWEKREMTASFSRLPRAPERHEGRDTRGERSRLLGGIPFLVPRSGRPGERPQARPAGCLPSSVLLDTGAPLLP